MNIPNISETQRNLIILIALLVFIWLGFGDEGFKVDSCTATVSKYVTAEFSETTTSMDMEGNVSIDTDYWSEAVSEVYTESRYNEMPVYPDMPAHDTSAKHDMDFDNFQFHTDENLSIRALNGKEDTTFTDAINKTSQCLDNIGFYIKVKTWWYITYGSDFK